MFFRFLCVGGSGFIVDVAITYILISFYAEPWIARIPAVLFAMLFTWLANRHFTYEIKKQHSFQEAMSYFSVSIFVSIINYCIFILFIYYGLLPFFAIAFATLFQAVLSFNLYRFIVFNKC
jgi:putative flippase GtrA